MGFFGLEKPALGAALAGDTAQRDAPSRVAFVLERRRLREVEKRNDMLSPRCTYSSPLRKRAFRVPCYLLVLQALTFILFKKQQHLFCSQI